MLKLGKVTDTLPIYLTKYFGIIGFLESGVRHLAQERNLDHYPNFGRVWVDVGHLADLPYTIFRHIATFSIRCPTSKCNKFSESWI